MEWEVGHVAGGAQERGDAYDEELEIAEAQVQTIVWLVAGVFVATSVVASVKLIRGHLHHFTQPIVQSKIIGILWMVPIYATDSWLSLRFKDAALYLDLMRDSYEGYVIYLFLALMIAYLGGGSHEKVVQILRSLPDLSHPWPFNKWCAPIKMGPEFIRDCKMATMQFVVLKPLMAFLAIVLEIRGVYNQGSFSVTTGYLYTSLIVNTSITYAFYYLVLFYLALGDHLKPYNPVPKFLCIKAVLFLSFWQSVVLAFLSRFQIIHEVGSWSVENVTTGIQNLLICFEMCFVALAHHHAFPYAPYIDATDDGTHASLRRNILADHLAFGDAMRDFNEVMPVVLPTQFKPGASILKTKRNLTHVTPKDLFTPENARLLNDEHEAAEEKDPNATKRGWKL
uniref:Transmembrane protein 184C n=1 Tax=Globisporangium ultimum (strain ATCC 200006 / CBS 805.95 / DAOM BR144) TaxID=431595 RepID=K3X8Z4_GLOUD